MSTPEAQPEGGRDAFTRERLQQIARMIDEELPAHWGFALFAFPFEGHPGRLNYVAKGDRKDIVQMVKDWCAMKEAEWAKHV